MIKSRPLSEKFLSAQDPVYSQVIDELSVQQEKKSCWIWFIFPQICGLGQSAMAKKYSLSSLSEAKEYFTCPHLRKRLLECTTLLLNFEESEYEEAIGGWYDYQKVHASMTLFWLATNEYVFLEVIRKFYGADLHDATTANIAKKK